MYPVSFFSRISERIQSRNRLHAANIALLAVIAFLASACSNAPKSDGLALHLNEKLEERSTLSGGRQLLPVVFDDLDLESTVHEGEARIRFSGYAVVQENVYRAESVPAAMAQRLGEITRKIADVRQSGSELRGQYQTQFVALEGRYSIRQPQFYRLQAKKGERIGIKGKATAESFGDSWEYKVGKSELNLIFAQVSNKLKGVVSETQIGDNAFVIGDDSEKKLYKKFDDAVSDYREEVDRLVAAQDAALVKVKEEIVEIFSPDSLFSGEYPYGNTAMAFSVEIVDFNPDSLSGKILVRNRNPWSAAREGTIRVAMNPNGGGIVTFYSPRGNALPGIYPLVGMANEISMALTLKDGVLSGVAGRSPYQVTALSGDQNASVKAEIVASDRERAEAQAVQEAA